MEEVLLELMEVIKVEIKAVVEVIDKVCMAVIWDLAVIIPNLHPLK